MRTVISALEVLELVVIRINLLETGHEPSSTASSVRIWGSQVAARSGLGLRVLVGLRSKVLGFGFPGWQPLESQF